MRNLVYIASGDCKPEYSKLNYDQIFLVDTSHGYSKKIVIKGKIVYLKMDALESFNYFKSNSINIDCLVTLCESRGEGGQTYSMCSDVFMGYFMQILPQDFIWICNDSSYYQFSKYRKGLPSYYAYTGKKKLRKMYGNNYVSLNLPYEMSELTDGMQGYITPKTFSSYLTKENGGHVFKMHYVPNLQTINISEKLRIRFIQDSIWNHKDELDALYISFRLDHRPMKYFFENISKVAYYTQMDFKEKLKESLIKGYTHVGFTPHYLYQYDKVYQRLLVDFAKDFLPNDYQPLTIDFFYLSSWFKIKHLLKAIKTIQLYKVQSKK